jgi:3D (Asp-Asp-Asp) domain-containing protein
MKISHIEVEVTTDTETVRIPFKKETQEDSSLVKGITKLKTEGQSGEKEIRSRVTLHDGVEVEREVIGETVVKEPVNQVMLEGTASERIKTKKLITLRNDDRSQRAAPKKSQIKDTMVIEATAYTHTGDVTATGTKPKVGTVAVDPDLIPYGTKLYIEGYGYGRAEDTGAFRHRSKPQIDLFMDTVKECVNWGRKDVTIYILK